MRYFKFLLIPFALLVLTTISCERDDICAEATPTTPHLVIRFHDASNTDATKVVRQLTILNESDELYDFFTTTDSISLPLRFQNENEITTTRFILKKDSDYDDDTDINTESNSDTIDITYTPQFIYVSRACGYKSIFNSTDLNVVDDGNKWIINRVILNSTIENENAAQIILYH